MAKAQSAPTKTTVMSKASRTAIVNRGSLNEIAGYAEGYADAYRKLSAANRQTWRDSDEVMTLAYSAWQRIDAVFGGLS